MQLEKSNIENINIGNQKILDANYWDNRYDQNMTGWDLGSVSPPIKKFIDTLQDKNIAILIPGCGNSYEADYLLDRGFTNIKVIDIAPILVANLGEKYKGNPNIEVILGDFFEHVGTYDLILEQTFFCALSPILREKYVTKMHQLLMQDGMLAGLMFDTIFAKEGPPFGGSSMEYQVLFRDKFDIHKMERCLDSVGLRLGNELWVVLQPLKKG